MEIGNTMCITWDLLGLSLKPLFFKCWDKDFYYQATPLCGNQNFYFYQDKSF